MAKGLPDPKVNCLLATATRSLWVGTDRGIVRWNGSETQSSRPARRRSARPGAGDEPGSRIERLGGHRPRPAADRTLEELLVLDEPATASEAVTALFEDREGNIWVGGARGIERLRDSVFITYSRRGAAVGQQRPSYVDVGDRTLVRAPRAAGFTGSTRAAVGRVTEDGLDKT